MKKIQVVVPWAHGLHLLPASRLVRLAQGFRSTISLRAAGKIADLRNVLSIVALCATMGTAIEVQATGEDEQDATTAIEFLFSSADDDSPRQSQTH